MEPYNRTDTMLRLAEIYNKLCAHDPEMSAALIYTILGRDWPGEITYNRSHLIKLSGMNYSKWNFIPDNFISQSQSDKIYKEVSRKLAGKPDEQIMTEYRRLMDLQNPDDAYGEGGYFRVVINPGIQQTDERMIINVARQQDSLLLVNELINAGFNFIRTIKFYAKSPRVTQASLKCDKVVIYYQKGDENANRKELITAIQRIITDWHIDLVDCISAFYHREFPGIGYAGEVGGDSFTIRIAQKIERVLNTFETSFHDVKFNGKPDDQNNFIGQLFTLVTQTI